MSLPELREVRSMRTLCFLGLLVVSGAFGKGPESSALAQAQAPAAAAPAPAAARNGFARWEKEIAAFEASDRTNPPPKGGIVFVGSSTIRRWTRLADDFPGHKVI